MERKLKTLASLSTKSFSAHLDKITLRTGDIRQRIRIDHPEAAAIIPYISDREILMVRQFRYALGRETLEIPAGKVDKGETPIECARRELLEETSYEPDELNAVYTYAPAIGYSNEIIHIFSAQGLEKTGNVIDEDEISSVEVLRLDEVFGLIEKGLILDSKTLIGLFMVEFKSKTV